MSKYVKKLSAEAIYISDNKNNEFEILVSTDAYRIGIHNSNLKLMVQ